MGGCQVDQVNQVNQVDQVNQADQVDQVGESWNQLELINWSATDEQ